VGGGHATTIRLIRQQRKKLSGQISANKMERPDVGHTTKRKISRNESLNPAVPSSVQLDQFLSSSFSLCRFLFNRRPQQLDTGHRSKIIKKKRQFDYSCHWRRTPLAVPLVDKPVERQIRKIRKKRNKRANK